MRHGNRVVLLLLLMALTSACSQSDTRLESIASQLSETANRCWVDVRDRHSKYEDSANCRSMSRVAQMPEDSRTAPPAVADRIAESARARAWMALAVSKAGDPNLSW